MSDVADRLEAARVRAASEKASAKESFAAFRAAIRPGAVASRLSRRTVTTAREAGSDAADFASRHPVALGSVVVATGLALTARPIGRFLADEFGPTREEV